MVALVESTGLDMAEILTFLTAALPSSRKVPISDGLETAKRQ